MLLWNKKILLRAVCLLVWVGFPVSALALQAVSVNLTAGQSELVIKTPQITDVDAPSCLRPGSILTVYGNNLNANIDPGVVLLDETGYYPLSVEQSAADKIIATLPSEIMLSASGRYTIAIKHSDKQQWITAPSPMLTSCSDVVPGQGKNRQLHRESPEPAIRPVYNGSLINSGLQPPPVIAPAAQQTQKTEDVEPDEILVASADMASAKALAKQLQAAGYHIRRRIRLDNLGIIVSVFKVPENKPLSRHLNELRQAIPDLWIDFNRHYKLLSQPLNNETDAIYSLPWSTTQECGRDLSIGMLDTDVDPDISGTGDRLIKQSFFSHGISPADSTHGTVIAALLAGAKSKTFNGLLPQVHLYAAAVFQTNADKTYTNSETILKALNWLKGKQVRVINISLGGGRNLLVELALGQLLAQGVTIVAAAGNNGPESPPVYPAAQPGVIAVTAVDVTGRVYSQANTGDYIDFSAYGVDLPLPSAKNNIVFRSGTSFAAPFVSARMLLYLSDGMTPDMAYQKLSEQVRKPGQTTRDPVVGWGLIKFSGCNKNHNNNPLGS